MPERTFWPYSHMLTRAERLVSEAAKMYRLDEPSPAIVQKYLDEASGLLSGVLRDIKINAKE